MSTNENLDFKWVIDHWDNFEHLAREVNVSRGTINNWYYRNKIPAEYWADLLNAADDNAFDITDRDLIEIAAVYSRRKLD